MLTEHEMIQQQYELSKKLITTDDNTINQIKLVAGVDLAYWQQNGSEVGVCCIVVLDYRTKEKIECQTYHDKISVPYIPGLLAFREMPLVLGAASLLRQSPDIYLFDGNGYLHPRHMGLASQAGIMLDKPAIGVAKSYYKIKDVWFNMPDTLAGSYTDIIIDHKIYGRALRTHDFIKPVFVSTGHKISLETATTITMDLVSRESHIPIPTRLADLQTHHMRQKLMAKYRIQ